MSEEKKSNQTSEPNTEVTPDNTKIDEKEKRKAVEESDQKIDTTRKSGYDENGKLDNPKFGKDSNENEKGQE